MEEEPGTEEHPWPMEDRVVKAACYTCRDRDTDPGLQGEDGQGIEQGSKYKTSPAFNFSWGYRENKGGRSSVREKRGQPPRPGHCHLCLEISAPPSLIRQV